MVRTRGQWLIGYYNYVTLRTRARARAHTHTHPHTQTDEQNKSQSVQRFDISQCAEEAHTSNIFKLKTRAGR